VEEVTDRLIPIDPSIMGNPYGVDDDDFVIPLGTQHIDGSAMTIIMLTQDSPGPSMSEHQAEPRSRKRKLSEVDDGVEDDVETISIQDDESEVSGAEDEEMSEDSDASTVYISDDDYVDESHSDRLLRSRA
jgi:hypothetical protein